MTVKLEDAPTEPGVDAPEPRTDGPVEPEEGPAEPSHDAGSVPANPRRFGDGMAAWVKRHPKWAAVLFVAL